MFESIKNSLSNAFESVVNDTEEAVSKAAVEAEENVSTVFESAVNTVNSAVESVSNISIFPESVSDTKEDIIEHNEESTLSAPLNETIQETNETIRDTEEEYINAEENTERDKPVSPDLKSASLSNIKDDLEKTKNEQGLIGRTWDGFKNLTGIGDGSDKVEKAIQRFNNGEITEDEAKKALEEYKDGQKTCVDVAADVASGVIAVGAFALCTYGRNKLIRRFSAFNGSRGRY